MTRENLHKNKEEEESGKIKKPDCTTAEPGKREAKNMIPLKGEKYETKRTGQSVFKTKWGREGRTAGGQQATRGIMAYTCSRGGVWVK